MHTSRRTRPPVLEDLRVNLIVARARAHLSQDDLAQISAVSRPTISRIERAAGYVGVDIVEKLAHALGTSVHELFTPTDADDNADDDELVRRASAPDDDFIEADAVLDAVDEAAGHEIERYSRAGRPPVGR